MNFKKLEWLDKVLYNGVPYTVVQLKNGWVSIQEPSKLKYYPSTEPILKVRAKDVEINVVKQFESLGNRASSCFADDSSGEWGSGYSLQGRALDVFEAYPEWQDEMREVADFLWVLDHELENRMQKRCPHDKGFLPVMEHDRHLHWTPNHPVRGKECKICGWWDSFPSNKTMEEFKEWEKSTSE